VNWIFGDNINTDLVTPGRYNITTDPKELAKIAFIEHRPEFAKNVKPGDFVIAGDNFGCGSSRETAVMALHALGLRAVVAKSFARIFYRNSLNLGLLLVQADTSGIEESDELVLDVEGKALLNKTKGTRVPAVIPEMMLMLHKEGGIIPFLQRKGLDALQELGQYA
jgi:3-isopropylmalate/(R)-2-methylmalate dehydratase small subunit